MRAVVIDGEAGMGKTTLWLQGVEEARQSWTVLVARPAEGETSLPFSALGDLLEPVLDDGADTALTDAQRAALDLALQRAPAGEPATRLALSRAVLELLRSVAAQRQLVVAVDDVQWLDVPTEQVLEFAFRRLDESPIRLLIARRTEQELRTAARPRPGAVARRDLTAQARPDVAGRARRSAPRATRPLVATAATCRAASRMWRQPVLCARDRPCAPGRRPGRGRAATYAGEPERPASPQAGGAARAGAARLAACRRLATANGGAGRAAAGGSEGLQPRSRRACSRSEAIGSASRTRCWRRRRTRRRRRGNGTTHMRASPAQPTTGSSARITSPGRRPNPTRTSLPSSRPPHARQQPAAHRRSPAR